MGEMGKRRKMGGGRGGGGNGGESSTDLEGKCRYNFPSGRNMGGNSRKMEGKWDEMPIFHSPIVALFSTIPFV